MTDTDKKLYELFSDKTLSEGCLVELDKQYVGSYFTIPINFILKVVHLDTKYEHQFTAK
jgi:hypothetical protein